VLWVAPGAVATWVRRHWSIEALRWMRDVTFGEDHSQVRTDHGPTNLAALRTQGSCKVRISRADLRRWQASAGVRSPKPPIRRIT
jgi:hypothetical protein